MASKSKSFVALIMFWGVMGLIWAALYDTIIVTIPASFSYAVADGSGTWSLIKYIWLIGMPIVALGTGIAALSKGNLGNAIVVNALVLVIWFITIFMWAALYEPVLSLVPSAMTWYSYDASGFGFLKDAYNIGTIIFMIGFALVGISIES